MLNHVHKKNTVKTFFPSVELLTPKTNREIRRLRNTLYLDLQQQSREAGDEVRQAGVRHTLLAVPRRAAQLHHLLGLLFTAPAQLSGVVRRHHALIRGQLGPIACER